MSRITYRGPDRFTPRHRTPSQDHHRGQFRRRRIHPDVVAGAKCLLGIGATLFVIFAYGAMG